MRAFAFAIIVLASAFGTANARGLQRPSSSITVLIDFSATWHNSESRSLNERLLQRIASAISSSIGNIEAPIVIRFLSIGDQSLARAPLCETTFLPQIISTKQRGGIVSDRKQLGTFLMEDCPLHLLSQPQEQFTDITGALDSVSRATRDQAGSYKAIIVLSDMKEERRHNQRGEFGSLDGANVLLLYRTLSEDRVDSAALDIRLSGWTSRLADSGAHVSSASDVFVTAGDISSFLVQ